MSEIRKFFKSRYPSGVLLELDFSQLEIYVLAYLSGDTVLRSDLVSGADLHGISAHALFGPGYTVKQRKIAKQLSFQLQYGAGAKSMAETNGIPLAVAKKFISNYYERYPQVKEWQDRIAEQVEESRAPSKLRTTKGYPAGISTINSETGRRYTFIEQDAPDFVLERTGQATAFSPTQMKNYPVQGFATADIVPMVLGRLYRRVRYWKGINLVGTIHDSVVFDCDSYRSARAWASVAKATMEEAPKYLKNIFNIDFDLPLKVGVEFGTDWYNMEELDI